MTCPRSEELVLLLDGALPPDALAEARRHAEECPRCRAELARLALGIEALRAGSRAPEPSPLFEVRLAARIAALTPRRSGLARLLPARLAAASPRRLAAAGGAAALAVAAALVVLPRHRGAAELSLAAELELSEDYEVVASVGDVENADDAAVVAGLDELTRGGRP